MQGQKKQEDTLNKIESIINFKELYYQQRQRRIQLEKQLEVERIKLKKLSTSNGKSKTRYCAHCSANIASKKQLPREEGQVIDQLKDFSSKLSMMKFASSMQECAQPSLMSKLQQNDPNRKKHIGMIENFAIFGITEQAIKEYILEGKKINDFQGQILYSKKEKNDSEIQASRLVFPSGMAIKKYGNLKAKQKTIQLMSYCYTNLKSFILNFQCPDSNFQDHFVNNDLLKHVNPDHRLFCICIGIHDYTYIENKKSQLNNSLDFIPGSSGSLPSEQDQKIRSQGNESPFDSNKQSFKSIQEGIQNLNDLEIGITQRVFCIMTYYPFFTFFEDILRNLINIVKMDRLVVYKHNEENIKLTIKQTDSLFQKQTVVKYFEDIMRDLQVKKINFNKEYELRLINQQKITQMTYWDEAKTYFVREWIYSILSMFTFQAFIDLYTLVMLQDRIVFICQNSHILTHAIYLFSHVLLKPLNYPFPVVNIIPGTEEDYLNAPFPVVYGMLKKRKSLQEKKILQNYDNTYIFLSPQKVDIFYQEDRKLILNNKSTKLMNNKQLREAFKDLKKTRKKQQKSAKYELQSSDYCILANNQEKEKGVRIVSIMNQFLVEEVVKKLPSRVQLDNIRQKTDFKQMTEQKDQHSYLMSLVMADMKKSCKDPFVLHLLSSQMVNNYLFT